MKIKGKIEVSEEEKELAISLLKEIAYDNGFFNRYFPETYQAKWINLIGPKAKHFFDSNLDLLNDEVVEDICAGEQGEVDEKYGELEGYRELKESLDNYFNNH